MEKAHKYLHEDLVDRCLAGDSSAFEQLYQLYKRAMFNICFRITNSEDDAEDVLQEAFISAFSNLEGYKRDATFGAWLKRIVINKSINHIKKRKIEWEELADTDLVEQSTPDTSETKLEVDRIRRAIEQLPDGYRIVFNLYLLEGYDHAEIAEILGISESTSKSQYNRSKKKLRELLNEGS